MPGVVNPDVARKAADGFQPRVALRHRGIDTTAHYAKADVMLLKQIAQPWPEVL